MRVRVRARGCGEGEARFQLAFPLARQHRQAPQPLCRLVGEVEALLLMGDGFACALRGELARAEQHVHDQPDLDPRLLDPPFQCGDRLSTVHERLGEMGEGRQRKRRG